MFGGILMGIVYCAQCEGKASDILENCPHCGHPLTEKSENGIISQVLPANKHVLSNKNVIVVDHSAISQRKWSPGVAAVLSFLLPGLGQIYKGQVFNGLAWMIVVVVGYVCLVLPGLILHLCCIFGALSGDPTKGR
jgi:TM2 domain-containing membrane protein YozV